MSASVERILEVVRRYPPLPRLDPLTWRDKLYRELLIDGLDVRASCRVFGGRLDLLVAHADTVGMLICPPGRDADAEVVRRLRRLAAGGDLDALILLGREERLLGIEHFEFACPIHVELFDESGAEGVEEARAA